MNNTQLLMKHFASVLRKKALGTYDNNDIDPSLSKFLSRKELIDILKAKHQGSIPKELDLVELENEQLLTLIGDELHILAHLSQQWCKEPVEVVPATELPPKKEASKPEEKSKSTPKKR